MKNKVLIKKFTLIEILLAIMISSIITVTLSTVIFNVTKSYMVAKKKSIQLKEYCHIDRLLDNVFKNAVPFSWTNRKTSKSFNNQKPYFIGQKKYLRLASKQPIYNKSDTGFVFTEFGIMDDSLLVKHKSTPFMEMHDFNSEHKKDGKIEVISKNVDNISFLYGKILKNGTLIFVEEYDIEENKILPAAIQITIKWRDGREKSWLRRLAGKSRYGAIGKANIDPLTGRRLSNSSKNIRR